jgi:hypothetical protein
MLRGIVMFVVWIVVIAAMVVAALMISAWLTGFKYENGFPDMFGMIEWIRQNYSLPF